MNSSIFSATITIVFLVVVAISNAQNRDLPTDKPIISTSGTDTVKKINVVNIIPISHELDSQKIKKSPECSYVQKEVFNPYRPYNRAVIAPTYNSFRQFNNYKEKGDILTVAGQIILSIIAEKTHHKY